MKDKLDDNCVANPVTDDSPIVFGSPPADLEHWKSEFDAEMYQCRYKGLGGKNPSLNILHIGTDLKCVSSEISKIIEFLESRSFAVNRISKPKDWSDADILIIGSDMKHSMSATNMVKYLPSNFGVITSLDVLFYGLDGKIDTKWLVYQPMHTDRSFSTEGVCMVHSRIRRWTDDIVMRGILVAISIDIENCIDVIMDKNSNSWKDKSFAEKIAWFKKKVKVDGHLDADADAELFFGAVDIVRDCRNTAAHQQKNDSKDLNKEVQKNEDFFKLAIKHKRLDLCPTSMIHDFKYMINMQKYYIRLATWSSDWVNEYAERYCQK